MRFEIIEPLWTSEQDKDIQLEIPFLDQRDHIYIDASDGERIANETLNKDVFYNKFGANNVYNWTWENDEHIPNKEKRL